MLADLWALIQTWSRPLGIVAIFFGPRILSALLRSVRGSAGHTHGAGPTPPPTPPLARPAKLLLVLQALFALSALLAPPYDVFSHHALSQACTRDALRAAVLSDAGVDPATPVPEDIGSSPSPLAETLLARLATPEARASYARWGHAAFTNCAWCRDDTDYALAAAPGILAPYLAEMVLVGVLGLAYVTGAGARIRANKYAAMAGWGVVLLAGVEYAVRLTWDVTPPRDKSDAITAIVSIARPFALLAITAAYLLLPGRMSQKEATQLATLSALETALNAQRLTGLAHGAVARSPALGRHAFERGLGRARAEEAAKKDPEVVAAAQAAGLFAGAEHARETRDGARGWITSEWRKVVRTEE
ncbi:hypothetical protein VHUM_00851 [Vanrija humicola]|uniref:Uncharacterized protein n=1 Tax=Vanrija humicola TaxID=5417 RepID=A0A7D8V1C9_VANHU|nr:hypothetical protein VHUM_00851 [Vanrija humicola]